MAQVVPDVQPRAGTGRCGQDTVAVVEVDGQRLLDEHGDTRLEEVQGRSGVDVVGGEDEDGVQSVREHVLVALVDVDFGAENGAGVGAAAFGRIGAGDHTGHAGPVGQGGQAGALAHTDDTDPQFRRGRLVCHGAPLRHRQGDMANAPAHSGQLMLEDALSALD